MYTYSVFNFRGCLGVTIIRNLFYETYINQYFVLFYRSYALLLYILFIDLMESQVNWTFSKYMNT